MVDGAVFCDHCRRKRCPRRAAVPYGPPNLKLSKKVCGWCLINNARHVREWIQGFEAELREKGLMP